MLIRRVDLSTAPYAWRACSLPAARHRGPRGGRRHAALAHFSPLPAETILFGEQIKTTRQYARDVTVIEGPWLPELAPEYFTVQRVQGAAPTPTATATPAAEPNGLRSMAGHRINM